MSSPDGLSTAVPIHGALRGSTVCSSQRWSSSGGTARLNRKPCITPQSSAVVTAIIALARSLGLRVVAEGVENLRQMEVLHRLGCGLMQGFLFSRPIPPEALQDWLEQTVLPRKAPWIGKASESGDAARAAGGLA